MPITMHRLAEGEVYTPEYHTCGYPLTHPDPVDNRLIFIVPPQACPIEPAYEQVVELAPNYLQSALTQNSSIETGKPYEWVQAIINTIFEDASRFITNQDWPSEVKSFIRDTMLRTAIIGYLVSTGHIVET